MKRLKGLKTVLFSLATMILPALIAIFSLPEWQAILPPQWVPYLLLAVGIGSIVLRVFTTTPIGKGE